MFTVTVSCRDELAVHSCPLLCLQRRAIGSGLFYVRSLLRNNDMATNLQGSPHVAVVDVLPHVAVESRHLDR